MNDEILREFINADRQDLFKAGEMRGFILGVGFCIVLGWAEQAIDDIKEKRASKETTGTTENRWW